VLHLGCACPSVSNLQTPTAVYHPNINLQGNVCLNILREDWKPVLDINAVIYGLIYLFYEPNPDDPLNHEAADLYRRDKMQFERVVRRTLQGCVHDGERFDRLI
jgi:ubiquitin-conjugating enzyme E2 M